ncbi:hypothetical protein [Knoellia sp. LjRoot47]|uniref:hypothetical protein n=1 Tax=Knoellia sp. LjRoot47 TaxID=3342330 RepID=UPI003ED059B0
MRSTTLRAAAVVLAVAGTVAVASPASVAPAGPSGKASCVGQIFVPQATGDPQAIALRIADIKGFIDMPWGQVVSDLLAHLDKDACYGE